MKLTLVVSVVLLSLMRSQAQVAAQPTSVSAPSRDQSSQSSGLVLVDSDSETLTKEFEGKVGRLIASQDFKRLDSLAQELRISKKETAAGSWHLKFFYQAFSELPKTASEEEWRAKIEFCKKWGGANRDSITARVAWGALLRSYAWHARGSGYADTVTDSGWKLFAARLREAEAVLNDARKLETRCPGWWDTMLVVALGEQWDLRDYDKIFNEAVALEPNYAFFYFDKAVYFLPRWHGTEGDWQRFAAEASDKLGGEAGDMLYARIGWRMHFQRYYDGFLRDSGYSWERMRRGLKLIVKTYPDSLSAVSELAYLSYQAQDFREAKLLFERIGIRVDKGVWGDDIPRFLRARQWLLVREHASSRVGNAGAGYQAGQGSAPQARTLVAEQPAGGQSPEPAYVQNITLIGISGPATHRLAMINDQTLERGETARVKVGADRVSVTCLEIKERSVVVSIAGVPQPREISLR